YAEMPRSLLNREVLRLDLLTVEHDVQRVLRCRPATRLCDVELGVRVAGRRYRFRAPLPRLTVLESPASSDMRVLPRPGCMNGSENRVAWTERVGTVRDLLVRVQLVAELHIGNL